MTEGGRKPRRTIEEIFSGGGYVQDSPERRTQVLLYKLLMLAAHADESVDERELNLIKSRILEQNLQHDLTESEWREIDSFRLGSRSDAELQEIVQEIMAELGSHAKRKEALDAVREIVRADEILHEREETLLKMVEENVAPSGFDWLRSWFSGRGKSESPPAEDESAALNPLLPVLRDRLPGLTPEEHETAGAALGLGLLLIHADSAVAEPEKEEFVRFAAGWCRLEADSEQARELARAVFPTPEARLETAYLARVMIENCEVENRKRLLSDLFRIAHCDGSFDLEEERMLAVLGRFLLLSHRDYIDAKLAVMPED